MKTKCQKLYILHVYFFSRCVKSIHQKKCRCTLLTHFEKNSKCVMLVPNLTHFEKYLRSLTCIGKKSSEWNYSLSFFSLLQEEDVFLHPLI